MAIILKNAPKTEEGRRLNLTKEQEEEYRIVFRFDKKTKKMANIEPWSAEGKYDNYCVIGSLTSYYYKTIDIEATYRIRNVENHLSTFFRPMFSINRLSQMKSGLSRAS